MGVSHRCARRVPLRIAIPRVHMKRLLLTVALIAALASLSEAQQSPDPRIADLVRAGKIQIGVHSVMYTTDSRTGALKAASTGIILLDIARTLGARIGVEVLPIGHPTIPEMLTCLTAGACDMGFMGPDRSRVAQRTRNLAGCRRTTRDVPFRANRRLLRSQSRDTLASGNLSFALSRTATLVRIQSGEF